MPVAYSAHPTGQDAERSLGLAMRRGFALRCPRCGIGHIFRAYLKVRPTCDNCGLELHRQRADDAPPYFTILIVGHIVIPAMLIMQKMDDPSNLLLTVIFVPLTLFLSIGLIRPIKGAIVGLMMSFNMLKPDTEIGWARSRPASSMGA
jgi:uncharacterized protein (DUF983 family)